MTFELFESRHSDEIAALLAVATEGSFVAAGLRLQRHPSIVSKRVATMEARLGVRLIERSTRKVRLTYAGEQLAERLRMAFASITDAEQEAALGAVEVRGVLRLSLPATMGRLWLGPMLPDFLNRYPQVSVIADYSERFVDLIAEGFDAAIRIGELSDSRLVAQRLSDHRRILCASPEYLSRNGAPSTPGDLVQHNCLRFSGLTSFPEWRLVKGHIHEKVQVKGTLTANDSESLLAAAREGIGILGAGEWLMSRDLAEGRLVRVLPDWLLDGVGGIYLVRPSARFPAATTAAFKEWIAEKFADGPPWALL